LGEGGRIWRRLGVLPTGTNPSPDTTSYRDTDGFSDVRSFGNSDFHSDGLSDSHSDGLSDCPNSVPDINPNASTYIAGMYRL